MLIAYKKPRGRFFIVGKPGSGPEPPTPTMRHIKVNVNGGNGTMTVDGEQVTLDADNNWEAEYPDGSDQYDGNAYNPNLASNSENDYTPKYFHYELAPVKQGNTYSFTVYLRTGATGSDGSMIANIPKGESVISTPLRRYRYLQYLYSIVFNQIDQSLRDVDHNEINKISKMRSRPKILHASNYEDAMYFFEKYKKISKL